MTVDFETNGNELILVYTPERGSEDIKKRLISEDGVLIKKTFFVNQILLREVDDEFDYEDTLRFCIDQEYHPSKVLKYRKMCSL